MRPIALVLLCALLSGCFTYSPARSAPGRAARVRVTLSTPTDFRLTEVTANEVVVVEGEIVRADSAEVAISALDLRARSGYEFATQGETLVIPRSSIAVLETRRISVWRSALVVGALVAVMTLTEKLIGLGIGDDNGGGGGGGPNPS
ncbi:MAG: hypothetical protein AB1941_25040 [Gemmatimonadota bacterium]